jgi:protein Tex
MEPAALQPNEEIVAALAVDEKAIVERIAGELAVKPAQVTAVVTLSREGATVPFISRYRKEATGSLDEVQVRESLERLSSYTNLESRRLEIIRAIFGQGKLTAELFDNLRRCGTLVEMEDIYAPFKKKKKTRGMLAREKGLEPLAEILRTEDEATVRARAPEFVRQDAETPELTVTTAEEAIQGAMDIVAESASQDPDNRAALKALYLKKGVLSVTGIGDDEKKAQSVYQMYWQYAEPLSTLKPHRILAINRGVREGQLEAKIVVDEEEAAALLQGRTRLANRYHGEAIKDGVSRLLSPAVLRELQSEAAAHADVHGIGVFSENLRHLLMTPPLKGTRVLGLDPGIRTGTKCAAMDETGKFLGNFVIYQERDAAGAKKAIADAVKKHSLQLIAIGNGTASQEVRKLVAEVVAESSLDVKQAVVDEDGASVYSASDVAREEFPELDLTVRGAISIGRRLQDPLAELVKIDPKSIGVGLYQHDLDQKKLSEKLDEVVGSVVNNVGVNTNTASAYLLRHVSGITTGLAKKIVKFRDEKGQILSREALREIPGLGPKTYEQCAGFMKIPESADPLDNTWVHPENYALAREILPLASHGGRPDDATRTALKERYKVGDATLDDILAELAKPNRDPRDEYPAPVLDQGVLSFEDLAEGMKLKGKVKNVVDFGAFIDIGIKESGLIHVSEMRDGFVKDPMEVLKVGDVKEFRVISLDPVRRRIGLSLRTPGGRAPAQQGQPTQRRSEPSRRSEPPQTRPAVSDTSYNPFADLLKKKKDK